MRCLLVDDEAPARRRLARLLAPIPDVEVVGEAADGAEALESIARLRPDVVLLDVAMPELDGLEVAAALPEGGPAVIFVTAYDEHALRAFELAAADYLLKPVRPERLQAALEKVRTRGAAAPALERLRGEGARRMAARSGNRYLVFDPARVRAILAQDHYSTLLYEDQELLADDPLDRLCERLDPRQFLRIHRSAAVNLAYLRELVREGDRRYFAVLVDGTRHPVSRERLPALKLALGLEG